MRKNTLKTDLIHDSLVADIRSGRLTPGDRLPSVRSLSDKFKVSISVVQNAMKRLERNDLIDRRVGSGVFVRKNALSGTSRQVLVCTDHEKHLSLPLSQKLQELLLEQQVTPVSISNESILCLNPTEMAMKTLDGIITDESTVSAIVNGIGYWTNPFLDKYPQLRAVFLGVFDCAGARPERAVLFDLENAFYQLTAHMASLGKKRIMLCTYKPDPRSISQVCTLHPSFNIRMGYERALREFNLLGYQKVLLRNETQVNENMFKKLMASDDAPDAIVCDMDLMALTFMNMALHAGMKVPDDLAVSGLYDTPYAEVGIRPVTSIRFDLDEAVRMAVQLALTDELERGVHYVEPHLIERDSTIGSHVKLGSRR